MTKEADARSLSEESLELLRLQAHRLRKAGRKWSEVAEIVGVHVSTVMSWARRFDVGGESAPDSVSSARRGRQFGEKRTISLVDEMALRDQIVGGNPDQMSLPFALWTRKAVQEAIKIKLGIDMPIRTVGEYLRRWGFTPQRPAKRAVEQRSELVQQWMQVDYPGLVRRAKAEGGEIYWADETAIRQDTAWVRGYAPAGQTPVLKHAARWTSITMISALTNQGLLKFSFYDGAINQDRFIEFLAALVADSAGKKVFLIVDNLRVHRAKAVAQWLKGKELQIEIHYLPPYSPEANPDEILNRDLKTELRSRPAAKDAGELKCMAIAFMEKLAKLPGKIKRYFRSKTVSYAGVAMNMSYV
ncbi:MAG TPA: IS630 family transposase [Accumulibacter sp.]|nr:IS630 family transposase [Accumulibacter sp.]